MENILRKYIRKMIAENINNFLKKEGEAATKQLKDTSKSQVVGDPLEVKLNQMADEAGSDEKNAPTVSVKAGGKKRGNGPNTGQHQAKFSSRTELTKPTQK